MIKSLKTIVILLLTIQWQCFGQPDKLLYQSKSFSLYGNRVEQGKYKAVAVSGTKIVSDYQSPANRSFGAAIEYKYSINGKDNETPMGENHKVIIRPEGNNPFVVKVVFGQRSNNDVEENEPIPVLPANTHVRFEVDMRPVLDSFKTKGYYTDAQGNKIFKSDFKGVWIAGGVAPLSWDFENLPKRDDKQMTDPDGDGIYTNELIFNSYNPDNYTKSEKVLNNDVSKYPALISNFPIIDALYRLSLEELQLDIRSDNTFMAGKEWTGVWTRDISYSIILSLALTEPEIAKNSLLRKVKGKQIIQDTGTGGSWPVSTDREVWPIAAWEVYKSTGDTSWLRQAFEIISASINNDLKTAFDPSIGLFYGESSFLDWRKQTYSVWMEPIDIYLSHNLGTNAVFYETLDILGKMGNLLGKQNNYTQLASDLKSNINKHLWLDNKNYYGQYLYGHYNYALSPRSEGLGEALCALYNIADADRKSKLMSQVPVMEFGIPCIYPQSPGIPPYHNNAIWPFVETFWAWAGAKAKNTSIVEQGIASVYRQTALFLTNKENMVADNGDFKRTEINSDYQLWSVAGNLAIIYRILFGIETTSDSINFNPIVPKTFEGNYELKGFAFRKAIFDVKLEGYGNNADFIELDGKKLVENSIPSALIGKHNIRIVMNRKSENSTFNLVSELVAPEAPVLKINETRLEWNPVKNAVLYKVYHNGQFYQETKETHYDITDGLQGEFQVATMDNNQTESFLSNPVMSVSGENIMIIEAEQFGNVSSKTSQGYSGAGFIEINEKDKPFTFEVNAKNEGKYLLEFRYANGNGPINTDNKCGIRSLYCNGTFIGAAIFPQRGSDEWSNWGASNPLPLILIKGINKFELRFDSYNKNMNGEINNFLIDNIKLIRQ